MLIGGETGHHLLIRMDVVSEISQAVTELLYVRFEQSNFAGRIYELGKAPLVKSLYVSVSGLGAGSSLIETGGFFLGRAKQNGFKHTTAKKDDGKIGASP